MGASYKLFEGIVSGLTLMHIMFSSLCRLFSRAGSNEIKGVVFFVGCDSHCHGLLNVCLFMWCILFFFRVADRSGST